MGPGAAGRWRWGQRKRRAINPRSAIASGAVNLAAARVDRQGLRGSRSVCAASERVEKLLAPPAAGRTGRNHCEHRAHVGASAGGCRAVEFALAAHRQSRGGMAAIGAAREVMQHGLLPRSAAAGGVSENTVPRLEAPPSSVVPYSTPPLPTVSPPPETSRRLPRRRRILCFRSRRRRETREESARRPSHTHSCRRWNRRRPRLCRKDPPDSTSAPAGVLPSDPLKLTSVSKSGVCAAAGITIATHANTSVPIRIFTKYPPSFACCTSWHPFIHLHT